METDFYDLQLKKAKTSDLRYIEIYPLSGFPQLTAGFTTRFGGVSKGEFASLNLNFNRPDPIENVSENYKLLSEELKIPMDNMVLSHQTHTNNVMAVSKAHGGMGILRPRTYNDIDGLLTNEASLMLVTLYADCVPIYFFDPVKKTIGLSHSGWRGTLKNIGGETVKRMTEEYGSNPSELYVSVGPHIGECCFEVGIDVAKEFSDRFDFAREYIKQKSQDKCIIDLQGIIAECLIRQGVDKKKIFGCNICTRCNNDVFFSHRGSGGKTGTGAAFMMIRG